MDKKSSIKSRLINMIDYRTEIMGIAIIWIMLFHAQIPAPTNLVGRMLWYIFVSFGGGLGVNVFIFASGLGLMLSAKMKEKNNNKEKNIVFLKRRAVKILPTFFVVSAIYYLFANDGIVSYFKGITTLNFWIDGKRDFWYISAIIIFYLLFPFIKYLFKKIGRIPVLIISSVLVLSLEYILVSFAPAAYSRYEIVLLRFMPFIYGMFCGDCIAEKDNKSLYGIMGYSLLGFLVIGGLIAIRVLPFSVMVERHWFSICVSVFFAIVAIILSYFPAVICRVLSYFGQRSLELYVVHVSFGLMFMKYFDSMKIGIIVYFVSSILLAEIVYRLMHLRKWLNNRKK